MEESSPDAYRAPGSEVHLPPDLVRTFAPVAEQTRAEYEAEKVVAEMIGLFSNHSIPITDERYAVVGDLAVAAVLTHDHS